MRIASENEYNITGEAGSVDGMRAALGSTLSRMAYAVDGDMKSPIKVKVFVEMETA